MKILFIGKFPPIQGGVSRNNDLLASQLGEAGNVVIALTNSGDFPAGALMYGNFEPKGYTLYNFASPINASPQNAGSTSRLLSKSLDIVEEAKIEIIISSYLEPYGVVGSYIAQVTKLPHIFIHAGSDIERLCTVKSLSKIYQQVFKDASLVLTTSVRHDLLKEFGVNPKKFFPALFPGIDNSLFNDSATKFSLATFTSDYIESTHYQCNMKNIHLPEEISPENQNYLIYGKLGDCKKIFSLLKLLPYLLEQNSNVRLYLMCHGDAEDHERLNGIIGKTGHLKEYVYNLPFIQNSLVPSLICSMTAVFVLEDQFDIKSHSSVMPLEVLSCNVPLIISEELYNREAAPYCQLKRNESVFVVRRENFLSDIQEIFQLAQIRPCEMRAVAKNGYEIALNFKRPADLKDALIAMLKIVTTN